MKHAPGRAEGMTDLLKTVEDPEIFADIAAFSLCKSALLKQKLLETLNVNRRLAMLLKALRAATLQLGCRTARRTRKSGKLGVKMTVPDSPFLAINAETRLGFRRLFVQS